MFHIKILYGKKKDLETFHVVYVRLPWAFSLPRGQKKVPYP